MCLFQSLVHVAMVVGACLLQEMAFAVEPPDHKAQMSWLDNGVIRLGIDLELGGAITWLSKSGEAPNIVNSYDWGRQIQMSFYSGPIPFAVGDRHPTKVWQGLGWNPIQSGDYAGHRSHVLEQQNDGHRIHVKCVPMQWPLDSVPGDCTIESWLELDGGAVRARCRLLNARTDRVQYPARDQEMPAVYTNAPWHRIFTYSGARPFTGEPIEQIAAHGPPEWTRWTATENWSALLDESGWGLGVVNSLTTKFVGGFSGKPGSGGATDAPCGYLSPTRPEILDWDIDFSYEYELVLGTADEIRARAQRSAGGRRNLGWDFQNSRLGWHYLNASDEGWPVRDGLDIAWKQPDPQLESPPFFCRAEDAGMLLIDAAITSGDTRGQVYWATTAAGEFDAERLLTFPIVGDGARRTYRVSLSSAPGYRGGITRLRIDPSESAPGKIQLHSVRLEK